jgi:hypothetical protein
MTNLPYVKKYSEKGELMNPIEGNYKSVGKNRSQRRELLKGSPFIGNKKGISLSIVKIGPLSFQKYKKVIQKVFLKDGSVKFINHWVLMNISY